MSNLRKWLEGLANELASKNLLMTSDDLYGSGKAMGTYMTSQGIADKIFAELKRSDGGEITYVVNGYNPGPSLADIQAQLERIEKRLFQHRNTKVCILCQQYTNDYTLIEFGSKYDEMAICHLCLDVVIDEKRCRKCKKCGCVPTEFITCDGGLICMRCANV